MKSLSEHIIESLNESKSFTGEIAGMSDVKAISDFFTKIAYRKFNGVNAVKKVYKGYTDVECDAVGMTAGAVIDYCDNKLDDLKRNRISLEDFIEYIKSVGFDWEDGPKLAREIDDTDMAPDAMMSGRDLVDVVVGDWDKIWKAGTGMDW